MLALDDLLVVTRDDAVSVFASPGAERALRQRTQREPDEPRYWLDSVSATFHGRDVMAPVAAHLSRGLDPEKLGPPLAKLVMLDWPEPVVSSGRIEGEVLDVDSFGNVTTNFFLNLSRFVCSVKKF